MMDYKKDILIRFRYRHAGFGGPFGKWFGHGFGPGGFASARFERGDLKLVILGLLKDKPRHGYELIQELEKRFHGFYSPSPGSVYPILQLLEDQDFVKFEQKNGKKVYTVTQEGEKFLTEHEEEIENMQSRTRSPWSERGAYHIHELREEIGKTAQLVFCKAAEGVLSDSQKRKKVHEAFANFRNELEKIIDL